MQCCVSRLSISFSLGPITDALSKVIYKEMTARINKRIGEILNEMDDSDNIHSDYSWALFMAYQELVKVRDRLRRLWKALNKRNGEILRRLRKQRDQYSKRGNTSSVTDKALLSMPTPPTVMDAAGILWRGGVLSAAF